MSTMTIITETVRKRIDYFRLFLPATNALTLIIAIFLIAALSFLLSLFFELFVLRGIFHIVNTILPHDVFRTIHIYVAPAQFFSIYRAYFFSIFLFLFLVSVYIGVRNVLRYRYVLAIVLLFLLVIGRFTGSSIGAFNELLDSKSESYQQTTLLGVNQFIRGDEWATEKPLYFAQGTSGIDYSYFNPNLAMDEPGYDMVIAAFSPVADILIIARPDLWGFLFLSPEYAFSFYWVLRLILLFMASFELGLIILKRHAYALAFAIIIVFSPPIQWWLSQTLMLMVMNGFFMLVLFDRYLNAKDRLAAILCISGVSFFALGYIMTMYPATQVPLAYVFFPILIWLIVKNKGQKPFAFRRIVTYFVAAVPLVLILIRFYLASEPAMRTLLNTGYPGMTRYWVTVPWDFELFQFVTPFIANSVGHPNFLNASEISQFFTFSPFLAVVIVLFVFKSKTGRLLPCGLFAVSLLLSIVVWMPPNDLINSVTFLGMSYPARIVIGSGLGFLLTGFAMLPYLESKPFLGKKWSLLVTVGIGFTMSSLVLLSDNVSGYFSVHRIGILLAVIIIASFCTLGYLLLRGGKKCVSLFLVGLCILNVFSTIMVNPLTQGLSAMFDKTAMEQIRHLDSEYPGRWIVTGNTTIANLVTAQGVARTGGTYYYPDFTMMTILDPEHDYIDLWNNFSHIDMRITDLEPSIQLKGMDLNIAISLYQAEAIGVRHVFTNEPFPESLIESGNARLIYEDPSTPWPYGSLTWRIYRLYYD